MALSTDRCSSLRRRSRRNTVEMGIESRANEPRLDRSKLEESESDSPASVGSMDQHYQDACLEPTVQCFRPCRRRCCAEHIEHGLHMHYFDDRGPKMLITVVQSKSSARGELWRVDYKGWKTSQHGPT
jgi:hypothetical protein